jgi:alkanesulfonate monooxygenase SsuD/methylene tetrahydromethanopterin reductase-like flavin-dependent oxidoreductase (luciferase family)
MRFGTFHLIGAPDLEPASRRVEETLEQITLADELGFDHAWVAEHHVSNYGYSVNPLLLIARASAFAKRLRFGQAVLVTPFWHPLRLAEDVALTDILTGGRLDLGLGRGYQHMEFRGFDLAIEDSRDAFLEQVEVMRKAWGEDDFTIHGRHFRVPHPITVLPRPIQEPHPPIWIAAQSTQSIDWAAEQGYRVMMTGGGATTWEQLGEWCGRFAERRAGAGHSEAERRVGVLRFVHVAESEAEAREAVWQTRWQRRLAEHLRRGDERIRAGRNDPYPFDGEANEEEWWDRLVYGTPDRCIAQLRRDAELGVTDAMGWFDVGGLSGEQVLRSMRLFATEVRPAVAEVTVA